MQNKVAAVIVNWGNAEDTLNCVNSLDNNFRIIIVDNGSGKDQMERLRTNQPDNVYLIFNKTNLGFAEGNNIGIEFAVKNFNPEFILLLNNDTLTEKGFLEPLISAMQKDEKIGAVQPKMLRMGDKNIIDSIGQRAYRYGSVRDIGIGELDNPSFNKSGEIFGACGAAVLYRKQALLDSGLFDKNMFCLFEDVDLSWKLRLSGWKILYEPASIVYHERGISGKITKENLTLRRFFGFRNCLIVTLRYYPIKYIIMFLPAHIYRFATALFFKLIYRVKNPLFKYIFLAAKERKNIQNNPLIKDIHEKWLA